MNNANAQTIAAEEKLKKQKIEPWQRKIERNKPNKPFATQRTKLVEIEHSKIGCS